MKRQKNQESGGLNARVIGAEETAWFDRLLAEHHYLGAGHRVGDYLRQAIERGGEAVALFVWGPGCYSLKDRDLWIGWSAPQRVERQKLVVQNRRFLLLGRKGQEPNLASAAMGCALRSLCGQWQEVFGYRPLIAESFTDPEAYAGTCYKASNWQAVGMSEGYSRHRADFYVANDRPKKLWCYELEPQARKHLRAASLPERCRGGLVAPPSGVMPVNQKQMIGLEACLRKAPDPRSKGTMYRTGPVMSLIAMALLAGRRDISEIARFANTLSPRQRRDLGLPRKKGTRGFYQVPGYNVFYQVLTRMDPEPFARLLGQWLQDHSGDLPEALAMDGKMIREHIGLLTLASHEDGAPHAIAVYDQKEGTSRCELNRAAPLLESLDNLDGKMLTGDPLHCQRANARIIAEKGGDYLFQVKGNQPGILKQAQKMGHLSSTPFLPSPIAATAGWKSAT